MQRYTKIMENANLIKIILFYFVYIIFYYIFALLDKLTY